MPDSLHILSGLNKAQQEAVTHWGTPLLILAGAGSGKTRALTHRAAWIIQNKGINPEQILMITFTNKASNEMKERITKLLSYKAIKNNNLVTSNLITSLPFAGTFHSFCARILRKYGGILGISPGFVIYDETDAIDILKDTIANLGFVNSVKPNTARVIISEAKNELISSLEYDLYARGEFQRKVAQIYFEYQKTLKKNDALDFDDLLLETVKLLKNHKDVLDRLRNTYKYILVDEWQDTNKAQYEIVKLLVLRDRNLTVVGDAAQSVYMWRGADYRNINYLQRDFPDLKTINLEQNYRSTQTILDAAYGVIKNNKNHPILKLWTDNSQGEKIKLYQARSELDEAEFIVNQVNQLIRESSKTVTTYSDCAILYRTNAQSRVIEEALLHAGIPYVLFGGVRFYERKEVKDVLAYLRILVNANDTVSFKRAEKLGKGRLAKLLNFIKEHIRIDSGSIWVNADSTTTLELLDKVLEETRYLELYDPKSEEDIARLENIKELRSVATEFPNPYEFLEQVTLMESVQIGKDAARPLTPESSSGGRVTLMTLHAAKGLEFKVIFIAGAEEGLFPHSRALMDLEELEEERRLAYVGITRAKERLYLTYASKRLIFGTRGSNLPSRFLSEIPEHLLEAEFSRPVKRFDFLDFTKL